MPRDPLLRLLRLALPFWRGMLLAALLGALTIASSVSLMATSAWLISKASLQPSIAELSVAVVGVRFFGIARAVFRYLERIVSHETTFRLLAELRVAFYRVIEPLAPARLASQRSGDLLSRAIHDIDSLQNLYLRAVAPPLVAVLIAVALTVFLTAFDPLIALTALVFMLAAGIVVPLLAWRGADQPGSARVRARAELNAALVDSIQGIAESLVYGQHDAHMRRLKTLSDQAAHAETRASHYDALQTAVTVFLTSGAALAVLTIAIPRIEGVYLATVALATTAVFEAFMPLAQAAIQLGTTRSAAKRLFEIVDLTPAVIDPVSPTLLPTVVGLEVHDLTFRYTSNDPPVLENVSLSLAPGQRIAILGASGAGKSTLVNLLLRFWEYDSGSIQLGSRDLREFAQTDVRAIFGVMSQRTYLFNTTIRDNIHIARTDASLEELETAAQQAHIHDFILSLPHGYDTLVGEDGVQISGGERQRIALARVLLKDAPILILDEATANLDTVTERAVMQTILDTTAGKSLLIFTHRHVLLDQMDRVYLIRDHHLSPYSPPSVNP